MLIRIEVYVFPNYLGKQKDAIIIKLLWLIKSSIYEAYYYF